MVEWWPNAGQRTATATTGTTTAKRAGTTSSTTSHCSHSRQHSNRQQPAHEQAKHHRRTDDWQWSSTEQQHMFAHHGLLQHTQRMTYTLSKARGWLQQQKKTSRSMTTNGCAWKTASNNQSSYRFTCVTCHHPFCHWQGWQRRDLTFTSASTQQSPTPMALKQRWSSSKDCIFLQSTLAQCQATWSSTYVRRHMAFEQQCLQWRLHNQDLNGSHIATTFGCTTAVGIWWGCAKGQGKPSTHQMRNVKFQRHNWTTTEERIQARWNAWGLWGQVQRPRRNMAQGQRSNKTSSTAVAQSISNQSNGTATAATKTAAYTISSLTPRKETRGTTIGTTTANEATSISWNSSSRTKGHTSNSRLLDQGRPILEESSCTTTDWILHPTRKHGWSRCHKATATTTNNSQTNIRSERIQDWWWLDNKDVSNNEFHMDRFNNLWGEHSPQSGVLQHR